MSDPGTTPMTVLLAGLGGQGVVTAGDLLIAAALHDGYEVKKSEIHGLSRRFGSVSCQVRLGSPLHSPLRGHGGIDILLALEGYEALKQLPYLKPEGVGLVNEFWLRPAAVQTGTDTPPSREDPRLQWFPGTAQAQDLEAPRSLNYYMLGVVAEWLPLSQPAGIRPWPRDNGPNRFQPTGTCSTRAAPPPKHSDAGAPGAFRAERPATGQSNRPVRGSGGRSRRGPRTEMAIAGFRTAF